MKTQLIDITKVKHIHFTGIKGVGMTALALCACDLGIGVSGSDVEEQFVTDEIIADRKISWKIGFNPEHIPSETDLLVFTAGHGGQANREVVWATAKNIPILSQAQAVGAFMKGKYGISVCGVGGKSTTAAITATILKSAGLKPSYLIGTGVIPSLGMPGHFDKDSRLFVAEADEYFDPIADMPKFLYQTPNCILLTNIEFDHPDVYSNLASTLKAFREFVEKLPEDGLLIANFDNDNIRKLLKMAKPDSSVKVLTYGFKKGCHFLISNYSSENRKAFFKLDGKDYSINIPGKFNAANSAAAVIAAGEMGVSYTEIFKGLAKFKGTKRRFEKIADINGISLYDDYAHHPSELRATLTAAKLWLPGRRLIAIFQPHTYSRTKSLFNEFCESFTGADEVIITKIYGSAREEADSDVSGESLAGSINSCKSPAQYLSDETAVGKWLAANKKNGDVVLTIGAGDIFLWHNTLIKNLQ